MKPVRVINLQVRPHHPVKKRLFNWQPVNAIQWWLEGTDKPPAKMVAYGILALAALYLLAHVVVFVCRRCG